MHKYHHTPQGENPGISDPEAKTEGHFGRRLWRELGRAFGDVTYLNRRLLEATLPNRSEDAHERRAAPSFERASHEPARPVAADSPPRAA